MDEFKNDQIEQSTLKQELNTTRQIISEIKSHVIENMGQQGLGGGVGTQSPQASHKLINLRNDVKEINRELDEILKAIILL